MLTRITIGSQEQEGTLAVTGEFFRDIHAASDFAQRGVSLRMRFYPFVRNWIVLRGVVKPPIGARPFLLRGIQIWIPKDQCDAFDGKVIGYERFIPEIPLRGFLKKKV